MLPGATDGAGTPVGGDNLSWLFPNLVAAVRPPHTVLINNKTHNNKNRYMAPPWAVLVSAAVFTGAHAWRSPTLFLLGVVLGCLYAWSRNLAHPLCLHALWNLWLFCRATT